MGESMTFTPGPWRKYRDKNGRVSKLESIQGRVCTFHPSDANVEANATLTESAPDMLAALKSIIEERGTKDDAYNRGVCPVCGVYTHKGWCWYEQMMAAIAKAEGRTA